MLKSSSALFSLSGPELLGAMADCMKEAICAINAEGVVIVWNEGAEALYEVRRDKILGRPITELFPNALLEQVRQSGIARDNVYHSPREGTHILISARPFYVGNVLAGVISSDRDCSEMRRLHTELDTAEQKLLLLQKEISRISDRFGGIIGTNPAFRHQVALARQIAATDATVLLSGESGTGKEVFARSIHEHSGRKGLFVPVNCSAIPSELFESEFFGYAPGAFTGASRKGRSGFFEMAEGGTIFLDEIGDMPLFIQSKMLRVLQEREVVRVGGGRTIRVDVRIISATNKSLREMAAREDFREDLFYRLSVVELELPPLRERREDIPLLVDFFSRKFSSKNKKNLKVITSEALNALVAYPWPGNIRELMNVIENMLITCTGELLLCRDIPKYIVNRLTQAGEDRAQSDLDLAGAIKNLERSYIDRAIKISNYNKSRAAAMLNIPRATLYYKAREYSIKLTK
jgi:transcriptional regulator with PAS, ATPase and Fis domain